MSKFYEVSKVLDKRTDAHGRVQYLVRWRGYGKKNDSWVDEADTNERLKQVFRTRHQGTPGLLQTLAVLVAEKLNMKKPPTTSIVKRSSVTMPMDAETFKELFGGLPSAPNLLQATKFSKYLQNLHDLSVAARLGFNHSGSTVARNKLSNLPTGNRFSSKRDRFQVTRILPRDSDTQCSKGKPEQVTRSKSCGTS